MTRQRIVPGAEVEFVTPDEMRDLLRGELREDTAEVIRSSGGEKTTAAGAAMVIAYEVPMGYEFELNRCLIDADGFTPGAPYTSAGAYAEVTRGRTGERVEFVSLAAAPGLPALIKEGTSSAVRFRNGEKVVVSIVGGPASVGITVKVQGFLRRSEA